MSRIPLRLCQPGIPSGNILLSRKCTQLYFLCDKKELSWHTKKCAKNAHFTNFKFYFQTYTPGNSSIEYMMPDNLPRSTVDASEKQLISNGLCP